MEGIVPCPVGLLVKSNVLVMDFLGKDMINAPRLKDADIKDSDIMTVLKLKFEVIFATTSF